MNPRATRCKKGGGMIALRPMGAPAKYRVGKVTVVAKDAEPRRKLVSDQPLIERRPPANFFAVLVPATVDVINAEENLF